MAKSERLITVFSSSIAAVVARLRLGLDLDLTADDAEQEESDDHSHKNAEGVYPVSQALKASTVEGYTCIVRSHLIRAFGNEEMNAIDTARVETYLASKRRGGLSARTVNRHVNVLGLIFRAAKRAGVVRRNPVTDVDRPRESKTEWKILDPPEVRSVEQAFAELITETKDDAEREWRQTCRAVFLVVAEAGLRRGEVLGLRWRALALADPDGATLRVAETRVRGRVDTPKSEAGRRTIPISSRLAAELFDHRGRSSYDADGDLVFVSPHRGMPVNPKRYAETFRLALVKAGITAYVRPFHDGRHSAITNAARAGRQEQALMTLAGHSDSRTTKLYTHLAGEMFRPEAERMGSFLWGSVENAGRNSEPIEVEAA